MKTLAIAIIAFTGIALSVPANAHMRCGWQWPNDDVNSNTIYPSFAPSDCMANQLNQQQMMGNER